MYLTRTSVAYAPLILCLLLAAFSPSAFAAKKAAAAQSTLSTVAKNPTAAVIAGANQTGVFAEYVYEEKALYRIPVAIDTHVTLLLHQDESLVALDISDSASWKRSEFHDRKGLVIKPVAEGARATAVMRTTFGIYELILTTEVPTNGTRVQQVRWLHPDREAAKLAENQRKAEAHEARLKYDRDIKADVTARTEVGPRVDPGSLNFNYTVSGQAPFRPTAVYDNGTQSFIVLPSGLQEMPVLFQRGPDGVQQVNYAQQGTTLKVPRLGDGFVLKLGSQEVSINNDKVNPQPVGFWATIFGRRNASAE